MNLLDWLLSQRRLVLTAAVLLSMTGALAWYTMIRQEDPRLPDYWGQVVTSYPGADAETVERQVIEPLEDALAEISEIKEVTSTSYDGLAFIAIELRGGVDDYDKVWDDVREAVAEARVEFPEGVAEPIVDDDQVDQDSVVLAVTGSDDPVELLHAARRLREALLGVRHVARARIVADPGEQVSVEIDDAAARRLGITPPQLAAQLDARNRVLPGGSLKVDARTIRLRPLSQFDSLAEIAGTPIVLPSGSSVPLSEIAHVRQGTAEPLPARMRVNGITAVGVAVVPQKSINIVEFGRNVREAVAAAKPSLLPLQVEEVMFQPAQVEARLSQLGGSLLQSTLVVAAILFLFMGIRLGLIVASVVPLVAMTSLAIFAWGGGVLHQISIAALVISLGMLVDNAIVVAENVQWRLDRGERHRDAAVGAVRELWVPLAGATGTTLAAFVPMLIAEGPTAVFTRTIPVVIMLTLTVSYLYAVFVTPVLSELGLVRRSEPGLSRSEAWGARLARLAVRRPGRVLAVGGALVLISFVGSSFIQRQFFPTSDRDQVIVDVKLPAGAHLDATDAASRSLEKALLRRDDVEWVASFVGRSAPRFYYNIIQVPFDPQFAQLVVAARHTSDLEPLLDWIRAFGKDHLPGVELVGRKLEQGPPVGAPIEVRVSGDDLAALNDAATAIVREVRGVPGTVDVRHNVGPGAPTLRFHIDDAAAARYGISRAGVATTLYGRTRGLPVGELRSGKDPIPVVVRSSLGEEIPAQDLEGIGVVAQDGRLIPLAQVARVESAWRPTAINHRDNRRVVTVSAQLRGGVTFSDVLKQLRPRLESLRLPQGVSWHFGGDAEGSGEANSAMMRTLPIGMLLLLAVLLLEFNSFRRVGIILLTVPLAAIGIVPGLLVSGQPFGFMSLLGTIALVGIVVNNAIILLEVVESRRNEGATLDEALTDAVVRRIRPILLTSGTTVVGLLPLAFSQSTLWPPLAWAIMSGLTASTMLTLLVVPSVYKLVFSRSWAGAPKQVTLPAGSAMLLLLLLAGLATAESQPLTLEEAMRRGGERPAAQAAGDRASAAAHAATAERRASYLPVVGGSLESATRDRELSLVTPLGNFAFGASTVNSAGLEISQPVFDASRMIYGNAAARAEAESAAEGAQRAQRELSAAAGLAWLEVQAVEATLTSTRSYVQSLEARLEEMEALVEAGRALHADALKIRLALDQARQEQLALDQGRGVARRALAQAIGEGGEDVSPAPASDWTSKPSPQVTQAVSVARETRDDLRARILARQALAKRRSSIRAEILPRVDARARWSWTDGSPYAESNWLEGAVAVTIPLFTAGTRAERAAALEAQVHALDAEISETQRTIETEVHAALAAVETARAGVAVSERGVEAAAETARVERERHLAGRSTTNDLLEAEAALRSWHTRLDLSRLELIRAWIRLWLSGGVRDIS